MQTLFNKLASIDITPNGFYVLYATANNISHTSFVNYFHERHRLTVTGFLTTIVAHPEESKDIKTSYNLTSKGKDALKEVEELFDGMNKAKTPKLKYEDFEERIIAYNSLFPKGKKEGSSVSFRTNPKDLFTRFKWFFAEYSEYTWEEIMYATEQYVKVYEDTGDFTYMQTSKYLIKKQDKHSTITSNLATMCYNIKDGNDIALNDGTFYFEEK